MIPAIQRAQIINAVAPRNQDDYRNTESGDVLLIKKDFDPP
jgi:hypothetical protein